MKFSRLLFAVLGDTVKKWGYHIVYLLEETDIIIHVFYRLQYDSLLHFHILSALTIFS